jgi:uncharacterized membrane protein YraQ (UPF0718 family)
MDAKETALYWNAGTHQNVQFVQRTLGLSLPETIILRKVLRPRLIALFFSIVAAGILVVG